MSDSIAFASGPRGETDLSLRWHQLRCEWPDLKATDAAALLGVSETELLACACGRSVTRLEGDWTDLLDTVAALAGQQRLPLNREQLASALLVRLPDGTNALDVYDSDGQCCLSLEAGKPRAAEAWTALLTGTLFVTPHPLQA